MRIFFQYVFIFLLFSLSANILAKESERVSFSPDNEYVFETKLSDGYPLFPGLVAYQFSREWYFPLYELTAKLGLAFTFATDSNIVQGNIITESRPLSFNLTTCKAKLIDHEESFNCNQVISFNDEIYISQAMYEKWFPLHFKVQPLQSLLVIEAKEDFPLMEKLKRERESEVAAKASGGEVDYGYPTVPKEAKLFDGFSQDIVLGTQYSKGTTDSVQNTNYQTNITAELMGFETHFDFSGQNNQIDGTFLNLHKVNDDAELMGKLHARQIDLYNFYFPSFPLVGGNELTKGAMITNTSHNTPTNFSSHHFQGELFSGWDVELYQNNLLIGRQTGNEKGQYSFVDVPLLYGINHFELIFYGPQGQTRHEYKTFQIGQNMPKDGSMVYRAASGVAKDNQSLNAVSFEKSITQNFSLNASYTQAELADENKKRHYLIGGFNGFADSLYYSFYAAKNVEYGDAYKATLAIPYNSINLKVDHANLENFKSREFANSSSDLNKQTNLELFAPLFYRLVSRTKLTLDQYKTTDAVKRFNNNLILNQADFDIGNELNWDSIQKNWLASPYIYMHLGSSSLRFSSNFGESYGFRNYKVEARKSLTDLYDLTLNYSEELAPRSAQYGAALTRFFKAFSVSFEANAHSKQEYTLACNVNFSFLREPRQEDVVFTRNTIRDKGSLSVLAFIDNNNNGKWDEGEVTLPNVGLRIMQTNQNTVTNASGVAFFTDLPSYSKLDVSIMAKSLPTLQHRSVEKGYRFIAVPGSSNRLEVPIALYGDIDGSILLERKDGPPIKRGINIKLIDAKGIVIKETRTDSEGYYLMEGIKPGTYRLEASIIKDGKNYLQQRSVTITTNGELEGPTDFHFSIEK